jgi:hypothetical protein
MKQPLAVFENDLTTIILFLSAVMVAPEVVPISWLEPKFQPSWNMQLENAEEMVEKLFKIFFSDWKKFSEKLFVNFYLKC